MNGRIFVSYVDLDQESIAALSRYAEVHSKDEEHVKPHAEAILCISIKPEELKKLSRLKFIQVLSAGVDGLPWKEIPPDVTVSGNMGSNAEAVAEHTWALILSLAKKIHHYFPKVKQGDFRRDVELMQLNGRILAVVGMGSIGAKVGEIGKAFNMHVIGVTRSGKTKPPADKVVDPSRLAEVFSVADFVVISTPLTKTTIGMIKLETLSLLKKGAVVVNVGRAEVVERNDLLTFLKQRPDVIFATDVWWSVKPDGEWETELVKLPNFYGTPWVAGAFGSKEVYQRMVKAAVANIIKYFTSQKPDNIIDRNEYV